MAEEGNNVEPCLPPRVFYTLSELVRAWGVDEAELRQWIVHGQLTVHVWLPLMSVWETVEQIEGQRIVLNRKLRHQEGYLPVLLHDCRIVFQRGRVYVRAFSNLEGTGRLALPESSESFLVHASDLVILHEERIRFEAEHRLSQYGRTKLNVVGETPRFTSPGVSGFVASFRTIEVNGHIHRFGEVQAAILGLLFEGAQAGSPWMNGKQLLAEAGSRSFEMSNVFKRNDGYRRVIESDGRGYYRMREVVLRSLMELRG